jgi:hypothetical protein
MSMLQLDHDLDLARISSLYLFCLALPACRRCLCRQDHGAVVLAGGVDMLEAVVASAQGEQDPRCLLLVFHAVRSLVALLAECGPQSTARLQEVRRRAMYTVPCREKAPIAGCREVLNSAASDGRNCWPPPAQDGISAASHAAYT